jgi:ribosomal protein S18 acetylase RimI-like enzyme
MLKRSAGLAPDVLPAIAQLEERVVAVDGGRLKLEWGSLRTRSTDEVNDVLWWEGSRLVGFVGLYCFDGRNVELVGMVDPQFRRASIGGALIDEAMLICQTRSCSSILLVVPRQSEGGRQLALNRGGVLDHSEYALMLSGEPIEASGGPDVMIRTAVVTDAPEVTRLLTAAFGDAPNDIAHQIETDHSRTLMIESNGESVGTVRVTHEGDVGGIYGFAVDPAVQGRGIGRAVLGVTCRQLRTEGATTIGLEVATQNERALGLYTSVGFQQVTTEDYYALSPTR